MILFYKGLFNAIILIGSIYFYIALIHKIFRKIEKEKDYYEVRASANTFIFLTLFIAFSYWFWAVEII